MSPLLRPICACILLVAQPTSHARGDEKPDPKTNQETDGYRLVWCDEFDTEGPPNPKHWGFERGFVRNHELQWYQAENAWCEDGQLVIEARREQKPNPHFRESNPRRWQRSRKHAEYTSASLNTRGKHQWQYGRFVMRAKINAQPGMWPAFWTLGVKRPWPANGEIDVMEYYRGLLLANAAWLAPGGGPQWDDSSTPVAELGDKDWADHFHVWRMDWTHDKIELFVDDRLLNEVDLSKTVNAGEDAFNPFRQPHYLLVNLAVGGTQGGDPSETQMPSRYLIDYVRVYQQQQ